MKLILRILALIALIIAAFVLLAVAKIFTPKHGGVSTIATSTILVGAGAAATSTADLISISYPQPGNTIASPLKVTGQARGNWYFEGSFPVTIVDWDGKVIGQEPVQAKGDWMTLDFVPFEGTINFTKPECAAGADYCKRGSVIFKKDNPSGLPQNDASVEIPTVFQ